MNVALTPKKHRLIVNAINDVNIKKKIKLYLYRKIVNYVRKLRLYQ